MTTFLIETVGCQMNTLDTELATAALLQAGFSVAASRDDADIILFNTCSVRQHAEDKVYSALGRLVEWKRLRPQRILGVIGCMAQKDGESIFRRAPYVDLVLGPGHLDKLCDALNEIAATRKPLDMSGGSVHRHKKSDLHKLEVSTSRSREEFTPFEQTRIAEARPTPFQAHVRVALGCDKLCTYCVVPSVRGPEQSRPPKLIVDELKSLADQGCIEVTLIGQTVNSYRHRDGDKTTTLADILVAANDISGLQRIRFLTNYPRGMDDNLIAAAATLPKVSPFFHVPAQSGSDSVLARMRRRYTIAEYRELLSRIRDRIPHAAIVSDFIVGFCGETEDEFAATLALVRESRFKNSYIFKYSQRDGTPATKLFSDDVPEETKRRRHAELLTAQNEVSLVLNEELVGRDVDVLVEGESGVRENQLTGRTVCDRIVVFDGDTSLAGKIVSVRIESAAPFTLHGAY
ncbi:MAG: tRNA (N6-isopentenyl adenosine(37)-C2)-methylthiotransferase MiaB [Thermoguttaceae bacterium]